MADPKTGQETEQRIAADLTAAGWDELDALFEARKILTDRAAQQQPGATSPVQP